MSALSSHTAVGVGVTGFATGLPASISALVDRVLERLAPEIDLVAAEAPADSRWMPRLNTGFIEAVPYRRGPVAMSTDAARGLLDLQVRDPRGARRVLHGITAFARSGNARSTSTLTIIDDTLVMACMPAAGPSLFVSHLA